MHILSIAARALAEFHEVFARNVTENSSLFPFGLTAMSSFWYSETQGEEDSDSDPAGAEG
jgi:hypothetical protein